MLPIILNLLHRGQYLYISTPSATIVKRCNYTDCLDPPSSLHIHNAYLLVLYEIRSGDPAMVKRCWQRHSSQTARVMLNI